MTCSRICHISLTAAGTINASRFSVVRTAAAHPVAWLAMLAQCRLSQPSWGIPEERQNQGHKIPKGTSSRRHLTCMTACSSSSLETDSGDPSSFVISRRGMHVRSRNSATSSGSRIGCATVHSVQYAIIQRGDQVLRLCGGCLSMIEAS